MSGTIARRLKKIESRLAPSRDQGVELEDIEALGQVRVQHSRKEAEITRLEQSHV